MSIWDNFTHTPGKILNDDTGDVACDHYHRYEDDIAMFKELGIRNYRFSISWVRILPTGTGEVNQEGVKYYNDYINAVLAAGMRPFVTIYHWDLPQALEDKGTDTVML